MASLTGRSVASSYKDLLQVSNSNSGIDGTARVVSDGEDTASKLFLDTNRVGVGIAPTDGTLHVHTASAGSVDAPSVTDDLIVENNDHAGIQILSPDDKFGTLGFGSPSDAIAGMVRYDETNKTMIFGTVEGTNAGNIKLVTANEVTAMTIDSSQNVGIGNSNPSVALDVTGQINASTNIVASSALYSNELITRSGDTLAIKTSGGANIVKFQSDSTTNKQGNYIVNEQGRQNHVANTMSSPYYRFDGVDDYIQILADGSSTFNTQKFSIEALVYMDGTSSYYQIWSYDFTSHSSPYYAQHLRVNTSSSTLILAFNNGSGNVSLEVANAVEFNKWQHIVATFEAGSQKLYVNGTLVGSATNDVTITYYAQEVWIGKANFAGAEFAGEIQKVRFFNNVLDATEVKELYSGISVPYKYKGANQTDLVTNGTMEADSNWTTRGTLSVQERSTEQAHSGSYSRKITFSNAGGFGIDSDDFTVVQGKQYQFIGYVYPVSPLTTARVYVRNGTDDGADYDSGTITGLTSGAWNEISFTYTASASGSGADVRLLGADGTSGTLYYDDVSVRRIGAVAEYMGSGIASDKWLDASGNDLHGTVNGTSVENAPSGDDGLVYEEGTWSPSIGGNATYDSTPVGKYIRIGNVVHISAKILVNAIGTGSTVELSGLPYPNHSDTQATVNINYFSGIGVSTISLAGYIEGSASVIRFSGLATSATTMGAGLAVFTSGSDLYFSATYQV